LAGAGKKEQTAFIEATGAQVIAGHGEDKVIKSRSGRGRKMEGTG
jgi:hypothetical protein